MPDPQAFPPTPAPTQAPGSAQERTAQERLALSRQDGVNEVWSSETVRNAATLGRYWLAHPMVQERIALLASGRPGADAYQHLADLLAQRGVPVPINQAISLGCGFGGLERDLVGRGLVRNMLGLDLAVGAITEARRLATAAGLQTLRYEVTDLEGARLPRGTADVIFAHQAVHHIDDLDGLFLAVHRALKPGGTLHLHEFVGPIRFQWTDAQLELANAFLDSLPPRLRQTPDGAPKGRLVRPTLAMMMRIDPTEAIRSSEIRTVLQRYFDIAEERALGGTLLHIALGDIAQNFDPADPEAVAALRRLFAMEDEAMAAGRIGSDFMTFTATPKRGMTLRRIARRLVPGQAIPPRPPLPAAPPPPPPRVFDENWYLATFPDVRESIASGIFDSGQQHWELFGRAEGRPGWAPDRTDDEPEA